MKTRRPIAAKWIAAVAGVFMLLQFAVPAYWAFTFVSFMPYAASIKLAFWNSGDALIGAILWCGLLVTISRLPRFAPAFAIILALHSLAIVVATRVGFGGIVGPSGLTPLSFLFLAELLATFVVLEATIKLWWRGELRWKP